MEKNEIETGFILGVYGVITYISVLDPLLNYSIAYLNMGSVPASAVCRSRKIFSQVSWLTSHFAKVFLTNMSSISA